MATPDGSFLNIGNFSLPSPQQAAPIAPTAPVVNQADLAHAAAAESARALVASKRVSVEESALMKQMLLAPEQDLHTLATAYRQGNDLGQDTILKDLNSMSKVQLDYKYGADAVANFMRYNEATKVLQDQKGTVRGNAEIANDMAASTNAAVFGTLQTGAVLGAQAVDTALALPARGINAVSGSDWFAEPGKITPSVIAGTDAVGEWWNGAVKDVANGGHTDKFNEQAAQQALENSLDQSDRKAKYAEETKDMPEGFSREKIPAWIREQSGNAEDMIASYAENPMMAGDLVPMAVGSMLPSTIAIKLAGEARAVSVLMAEQGMSREAAGVFLKTQAGRALLQRETLDAVPTVVAGTESGSAVMEAQNAILNATPEELAQNPQYKALLAQDFTPEQAKEQLASRSGEMAGAVSATLALGSGRISAPFEAAPLKVASGKALGSALGSGAKTTGKEMLEEGFQSGSQTFASNAGQIAAGQQDVSLGDNLGATVAQGVLGGLAGAGALQAPGVALKTTGELGRATGEAVVGAASAVLKSRKAAIAADDDATSPVGSAARASAAETAQAAAENIRSSLSLVPTTEGQTEAKPTDPKHTQIVETLNKAFYADEAETAGYAGIFPGVKAAQEADPSKPVSRAFIMEEATKAIEDESTPKQIKEFAALSIFSSMDDIRSADSEEMAGAYEVFTADDPVLQSAAEIKAYANTLESSPAVKAATKLIQGMTQVDVDAMLPVEDLQNGTASAEQLAQTKQILDIVGRVNVGAVNPAFFDMVLEQVGSGKGKGNEILRQSLEVSKQIALEIQAADAAKKQIDANWEASVKALPAAKQEAAQSNRRRTIDSVRENVDSKDEGELLSLSSHRARIGNAIATDNLTEAAAFMKSLGEFAVGFRNKVNAINASAANKDGKPVPYMAYRNGKTYTDEKGAFAQVKSANGVLYASEVYIDASSVIGLYNSLLQTYGAKLGVDSKRVLKIPELHESIAAAQPVKIVAPHQVVPAQSKPKQSKAKTTTPATIQKEAVQSKPSATPKPKVVQSKGGDQDQVAPTEGVQTPAAKPVEVPAVVKPTDTGAVSAAAPVTLPPSEKRKDPYLAKDQLKANKANKFIGVGSSRSSTNRYAKAYGDKANSGSYEASDVVFISAEGARSGRLIPNFSEMRLAIKAGATLITDDKVGRSSPYNVGEREVAALLVREGYVEKSPGEWVPITRVANSEGAVISEKIEEAGETEVKAKPSPEVDPADEIIDEISVPSAKDEDKPKDKKLSPSALWMNGAKTFLIQPAKWANRFLESFRASNNGSTFFEHESGAEFVLENLNELHQETNGLTQELTPEQRDAVTTLLTKSLPNVVARIQASYAKEAATLKGKSTWNDSLKDGSADVLSYKNALPANFLTEDADGKMILHPQVLEAAVLAGLEWSLANSARGKVWLKDDDVTKRLGVPRGTRITPLMREAVNSGVMLQEVLQAVSKTTMALMGVEPNRTASSSYTQGIFSALASNVIKELAEEDVISLRPWNFSKEEFGRALSINTVGSIRDVENSTDTVQVALKELNKLPDVFSRIFGTDSEVERFIGEAPKKVPTKITRNPFGETSEVQRDVMEDRANSPFKFNMPLIQTWKKVGTSFLADMLGYTEMEGKLFNKAHAKSVDGKNISILHGFHGVQGYMDQATDYMAGKKMGIAEAEVFFKWAISSVGRLQQQGPITPQGDKTARGMVTITNATINLNDAASYDNMWLAVAQSTGTKVEQMSKEKAVSIAQDRMRDPAQLKPAVDALKVWLQEGSESTAADQAAFKKAVKVSKLKFTMAAFHALMTVARADLALEQGTDAASVFETSLSFEADGVTDGPINAMIHMAVGAFNQHFVDTVAKGGVFFSGVKKTLAEHKVHDKEDLYHVGARVFKRKLSKMLQDVQGNEETYSMGLVRTLDALLEGFSIAPNINGTNELDFEIDRGVTKNPLTVFLYGSSVDGIAGKVLGTIEARLYEIMTEVAQSGKSYKEHPVFVKHPQLAEDLQMLMTAQVDPDTGVTLNPSSKYSMEEVFFTKPVEAYVQGTRAAELQKGISMFFATPMSAAIDEATGGLSAVMRETQQASQVQALIFKDALEKAMNKRTQERVKDGTLKSNPDTGKATQLLSEKDLTEVFQETMKLAPVYETATMEFHIAGKTALDSSEQISTAFDSKFAGTATLPGASEASVKVSPYLTIGTGDGQMIMNIYMNNDGSVSLSLPVFDGVELGIDKMNAGSEYINEQVYNGWMDSNTYRSIADGYQQMLTHLDFGSLSDETRLALKKTLRIKVPVSQNHLYSIHDAMVGYADSSDARKEAMSRMNMWVDHMAGAGSPYNHVGVSVSDEDVVEQLKAFYEEALSRIQAENKTRANRPVTESTSAAAKQAIADIGRPVEGYAGVTAIRGRAAQTLVSKAMKASNEQIELMKQIAKVKGFDDVVFYYGSAKDLNNFKSKEYPLLDNRPIQEGQAFVGAGVIFITNASAETVLHEAIHAYTLKAIASFYADAQSVPEHVRDAMKRLEVLQAEFQELDPNNQTQTVGRAMVILQKELARADLSPTQKMAEFLAWTLANQNLSEFAANTRVRNPLLRVAKTALVLLQRLLRMQVTPGKSMLSNVRFNAQILGTFNPQLEADREASEIDQALDQIYATDEHIRNVENGFSNRLQAHITANQPTGVVDPATEAEYFAEVADLKTMAEEASAHVVYQGFPMPARSVKAFEAVYATMMSGMAMDPSAIRRINKLYDHVLTTLTEEDFLKAEGLTDATATGVQHSIAAMQLAVFTGDAGLRRKTSGQTDLLATFMALAEVNETFRHVLSDLLAPKDAKISTESFDDLINSASTSVINSITKFSVSRQKQSSNVRGQLDVLGETLSKIHNERNILTGMDRYNPVERLNDIAADKLAAGTKKLVTAIEAKRIASTNKYAKGAWSVAQLVTSLGSKETSDSAGEGLVSLLNKSPRFRLLSEALNDLRGQTESNKSLMQLLNPVKAHIESLRQEFREKVPEELAKVFTRKITKHEQSNMHMAIGRADIMALGKSQALDLLSGKTVLADEITKAEELVQKLSPVHEAVYKEKAIALATYMTSREVISNGLLSNATAIAYLLEEAGPRVSSVTPELIEAIDKLTSLYAYSMLDPVLQKSMTELVKTQPKGMSTIMGYHAETRAAELDRMKSATAGTGANVSLYNGWKGYIPSTVREGAVLRVEDESKDTELKRLGYVRLSAYDGDTAQNYRGKRSYYKSTVGGRNSFNQGVAQTVHTTWQGVDVRTGFSKTSDMGGSVLGSHADIITKKRKAAGINNKLPAGDYLIPRYDANGKVYGYEMPMAPRALQTLDRDTHLGRMLGVWSGRIVEETASDESNKGFIKVMFDQYEAEKDKRGSEYINIADPKVKDLIHKDAWNALGWKIKSDAADQFGRPDFFPVRVDLANDAFGYRAAGVTDPWTGLSRLDPKHQKMFVDSAMLIMGKDAYKYLKMAETTVMDVVSYAKTTIVVRSVSVAFNNLLGNDFHLMMHGMNPISIVKGMRDKFVEINTYVKNREAILTLRIALSEVNADPVKAKNIRARITAYEDANANMSIAPLLAAGEFNTVSESLTEADVAIGEGRFATYMEGLADKLPGTATTIAKNLIVAKDTALYQGLNRMVQYGDFVAKAVLYEHLTKTKGVSSKDALDTISEEFVNYNRLSGRGRDFVEAIGLWWFAKYKIRITKIALNMARTKPLTALLMAMGVEPFLGVDSVFGGSLPGKYLSGGLSYSMGPGMGLSFWQMNPWWNVTH